MKPTIFRIKLLLLFFSFYFSGGGSAQYLPEWAKGFGGDRQDQARAAVECPDGNFIITGEAIRKRTNTWLLKLNPDGNKIWGTVFEDSYYSKANAISYNDKNQIVTAGRYIKTRRKQDVNGFIMVSDSSGNPIWLKEYGDLSEDEFRDLIVTSEGKFAAAGYSTGGDETQKRLWFLLSDNNGNILTEKTFADSEEDAAHAIIETQDGNFVIAGYAVMNEKKMMRILKIDPEGNVIFDLPFNPGNINEIHDIIEAPNGSIYACGTYRVQPLTDYDDMLAKISPEGDLLFRKTYGRHAWEEATSIVYTFDDFLVIGGFEKSDDGLYADFKIRKTDTAGQEISLHTFSKRSLDFADDLIETSDKGLLLAGSTYHNENGHDYAVLKYKNVNRTDAEFLIPEKLSITTSRPVLKVKICINGFAPPEKSLIFLNNEELFSEIYNPLAVSEQYCLYPVYLDIPLKKGLNTIAVLIEDRHGYTAEDIREVYYLPEDDLNW